MKKVIIAIIIILTIGVIALVWYLFSGKNSNKGNNIVFSNSTYNNNSTSENEVNYYTNDESIREIKTALKNSKWLLSSATMKTTYLGESISGNVTWKFIPIKNNGKGNCFVYAEDSSNSAQVYYIKYSEGKIVSVPVIENVIDTKTNTVSIDATNACIKVTYDSDGYKSHTYYQIKNDVVTMISLMGYYPEYGSDGKLTGNNIYYYINTENTVSESEYNNEQRLISEKFVFEDSMYDLTSENIENYIK